MTPAERTASWRFHRAWRYRFVALWKCDIAMGMAVDSGSAAAGGW